MAQTTILAAGSGAATSSDVTVPPGGTAIVSMFIAAGSIPGSISLDVNLVTTAGAIARIGSINGEFPATAIYNPTATAMVYRITRPNIASSGYSVGAIAVL